MPVVVVFSEIVEVLSKDVSQLLWRFRLLFEAEIMRFNILAIESAWEMQWNNVWVECDSNYICSPLVAQFLGPYRNRWRHVHAWAKILNIIKLKYLTYFLGGHFCLPMDLLLLVSQPIIYHDGRRFMILFPLWLGEIWSL